MANSTQGAAALLARVLISVIFLVSAFGKVTHPKETIGYIQSRGLPVAHAGLPVAVLAETLGGLSVLVGFRPRAGASLLLAFLVVVTLTFHNFWTYPPADQQMQSIQFLKNTAIMGGLLMVLALGAGPWTLDQRLRTARRQTPSVTQT